MKYTFLILLFLISNMMAAQLVTVSSSDTTITIHTQGREYVAQATPADSTSPGVSLDSAYVVATAVAISDWSATLAASDSKIARQKARKATASKAIKELKRKAKKASNKGASKVVTVTKEVDEVGSGSSGATGVSFAEAIKGMYDTVGALEGAYKNKSRLADVAVTLGLSTSGTKSAIAKRIFDHVQ